MGGAGGHMRHPHDLAEIKSGKDLIDLFTAIPAYLRGEEFKKGVSTSLKLDGSNNAIKVVEYGDDDYQFAIDRGGKGTSPETQLDVMGVTIDRLKDRFTKVNKRTGEIKYNEGLANASAGLINMMAKAKRADEQKMRGLLEQLKLIDENGVPDSTKFINVEYIDRVADDIDPETGMGRANAIYYNFDSITFLNISEFYKVVADVTRKDPVTGKSLKAPGGKVLKDKDKLVRDGAERPEIIVLDDYGNKIKKITDDPSRPMEGYNREALDELADMVAPYAPKSKSGQQFEVLGPGDLGLNIDHDAKEGENIEVATERAIKQLQQNIENTLNSNLTFMLSDQASITKTLREWLMGGTSKGIKNIDYKPFITLVDGSKKNPFHQDLHNQLVDLQTPLNELVPLDSDLQCEFDGSLTDCEKAIYGAIFNEAARRLGNVVKQSLQSKIDRFGSAVDHEGVVINAGMKFAGKKTTHTFKLTGEFIVDKNQGVYAMREGFENEADDPVIDEEYSKETIAIVPGAFKPPHQGHADMVRKYATGEGLPTKADKVIILISAPTKAGRILPIQKSEVKQHHAISIWNNVFLPDIRAITDTEIVIDFESDYASPVQAAYDYIGNNGPFNPMTQKIILGASNKPDTRTGIPDWHRWKGADEKSKQIVDLQGTVHKLEILDPETYAVPCSARPCGTDFSATDLRELVSKLLADPNDEETEKKLSEFIPEDHIDVVLAIFRNEKIEEKPKELEEMASMAGASVGIGAGRFPAGKRDKKSKKRKKQQENIDNILIDDVMKLIMERGILR